MIFPIVRRCLLVLVVVGAGWGAPAAAARQLIKDVSYLESGRKEKLDLYLPARAADDPPAPGVVWIHGGESAGAAKDDAAAATLCGALADAGYVCASIDYRAGEGAWPANLYDCKNAVRFLRAHAAEYHVDPDRLAVLGDSAGGRLSLMVGFTADAPGFEPPAPYPGVSSAVIAVGDLYGAANPTDLSQVSAATPPVLIAQGVINSQADAAQSRELDRVLTAHGVPHEFRLVTNPGPAFDLRPLVLNFLRSRLGIPAHGLSVVPIPDSPRVQVELDSGWKFYPADNIHGPEVGFDDTPWASVNVPHTWNARDGEDGGGNYRRGVSWYRRHFTVDPSLAGKRFYLQFDGVSLAADVYVNGALVGAHQGGFARFCLDATDSLKVGQDNLISVRVDNEELGIPPISADFTVFGGITRPVRFLATNQIQISTTDFGSPGVFIDQPRVSADQADVVVRAQIENYYDDDKEVEIHTHVLDAAGREVFAAESRGHIGGGDAVESRQAFSLEHPHLWDGEADPYLYTVRVEVVSKRVVVDSVTQPLGLRFFRVDPDRGFFLNGRHLDLHGVDRHQDRPDQGWAISEADEAEDFALIRDLGCSAVRIPSLQGSDSWYQRCDRSGIIAWAEIPVVNEVPATAEFLKNAKQQLDELIRQNYNHPSICFWSCGNGARGEASDHVIAELAALAAAEDATRLSAYASNANDSDSKNWHTAVVDFNHYAGWYGGESADLAGWLDKLHQLHPAASFGLSEYGAGGSVYQHQYPARHPQIQGSFHPEEYQADLHETSWLALQARPYVWSKFVFSMFDFANDGLSEGDHPGINDKGLVTYDRQIRKDAFFWYKSNWSNEPLVYITSRRFLERHKPLADVKVYSNSPEVELALNGESLGVQRSANHIFIWKNVKLTPGENHVAATSRFGGLSLTDGVTWTYLPFK
jgi:beta-galactosidase